MVIIAEYTIHDEDFPLGVAFSAVPSNGIEIERLRDNGSSLSIYFWVQEPQSSSMESDLEQRVIFDFVTLVDTVGNEHLYRVDWNSSWEGVLIGISETGLTLDSAVSRVDSWNFKVRTETMSRLSKFQKYCRENEFHVTLTRFPTECQIFNGLEFGVTDAQRDAMAQAYVNGYFDEPRGTTLEVLAESLEVTQPAVLARLRKGQRNLLENTIVRSINANR